VDGLVATLVTMLGLVSVLKTLELMDLLPLGLIDCKKTNVEVLDCKLERVMLVALVSTELVKG
jgi:hypothetical protein